MDKKRHFSTFYLAGFSYWDGCTVFNHLNVGTGLQLKFEPDNKFDAYAVAVYFEDHKLGYVPRSENKQISKFLEMGHSRIFEVRINQKDVTAHPEQQIGVIVYLKNIDTLH